VERSREEGRPRSEEVEIAEVSGGRSTIIIPASGWVEFRDTLNNFIDPGDGFEALEED
jgi:hypothetical protein